MGLTEPPVNQYPFLAGGGSMGEHIRAFNWANTHLGTPEVWPSALKIAVGIMLRSPFPKHITWGNEFTQLYNDAYRPVLGKFKHPAALGIPIENTFPEIWDTIGPMLKGVMDGKPVRIPNFKIVLERNGFKEECYFDFAYSPIIDEMGVIQGVLTNVIETSDKVRAFAELKRTQEELRTSHAHIEQERDRLMQFFMESPAGICILEGKELRFQMVNSFYQELFPGRELLGKTVLEALPELEGDPIINVLNNVMRTGITYRGTDELVPLSRTDLGEVEDRYFDLTYQARLDPSGEPTGILVFAIEVTARKHEEQRKNDFINIVSHELKTPLTSLTAIVQLVSSRIRKTKIEDKFISGAMDRADGQIKRMVSMITGFLNISRLESGHIFIEKSHLDFTGLVIEAMDELQLSSLSHQLIMECRDVHMVWADREKMISVVTNLMANAVKYSPAGGKVEMDCSIVNDNLVFSVKDEGIGIDAHELPKIFERYYRVSGSPNISGFGIGLYLSAEIVHLHGGRIWAESELGKGSKFSISLPCS